MVKVFAPEAPPGDRTGQHHAGEGNAPDQVEPAASADQRRADGRRRRRRTRIVLLLLVALIVGGLGYGLLVLRPGILLSATAPTVTGTDVGSAIGDRFPTIAGQDYDGQAVSVSADDGSMIVGFVAHWCEVCREDVRALEEAAAAGTFAPGADAVRLISTRHLPGIAWPPDEELGLNQFANNVIVDTDASVADYFDLGGTPSWIFTDEDGVIRNVVVGALTPEELAQHTTAASG